MAIEDVKTEPKSVTVTRVDGARETEPHPVKEYAEKGASTPAPIPEDELPSRDRDLKKARAMLEGKDPKVVEAVDQIKADDGLVKVVKGGKSLDVHPDAVDAHLAAGWRVDDEEIEAAEKKVAEKAGPASPAGPKKSK